MLIWRKSFGGLNVSKVHLVSEVNEIIKSTLAANFLLHRIIVKGEISNYKKYDSGHAYFTLKDEKSVLKAVMFRSRSSLLRFKPQNGQSVLASGRIEVYERDGVYQIYVDNLFPDGAGDLALKYEELKEKLSKEGLFDNERKRPLVFMPKVVGVITSSSGAVLHDIITVVKKRNPSVKLVFLPIRVQGKEAPGEISHAIKKMNEFALADTLIVGRGGGSIEDLWAFNDELVVRAIAASVIPVISAVGHETDVTLADFVSDVRAATPSQAAEFAVPDRKELLNKLEDYKKRLNYNLINKLENLKIRFNHCKENRFLKNPQIIYEQHTQNIDFLAERLKLVINKKVDFEKNKFAVLAEKLNTLSPLSTLLRGYSVVIDKDNYSVKDVNSVKIGDALKIKVSNGSIFTCVENIEKDG